jgi:hypothetical protein
MGTEPSPASDLATLQDRLDTEAVTFVDTVNDELATLIEDADLLAFDYLIQRENPGLQTGRQSRPLR